MAAPGLSATRYLELSNIDVSGQVDDAELEHLHKKARLLGNGTVDIHAGYTGFGR